MAVRLGPACPEVARWSPARPEAARWSPARFGRLTARDAASASCAVEVVQAEELWGGDDRGVCGGLQTKAYLGIA
uniref:Uncharacterized protein n=1 Tax=Oryza sativa subsp. japonica TaxID=39947 RepID=Q5Z7R0_ORYSJ|nr:hypothetical protein [Oryza sativa Japonica Group]